MAHLVRPMIVRYIRADGSQGRKGEKGVKIVRERSSKWYGVGIPGHPPRKRFPLASDKVAAQRMLDNMVRQAERGQAALPDADAKRTKLADFLDRFETDLGLGLATRKRGKAPPKPKQVAITVQRVRDLLTGCGFVYPGDLNSSAPATVAKYLRRRVDLSRKEGGISHQTAAFFLAAISRFVWWLHRQRVPVTAELFDDVPGFEPDANRVHSRRAVSPAELATVLDAARTGETYLELTGEQRYALYLTAFSTGFRAEELASLTPECFLLESEPPLAVLPAKKTKNRKAASVPLMPAVAVQIAPLVRSTAKGKPVWPGRWYKHGARMLRKDLKAAGVPYVIEGPHGDQYADFHALRHSFVTALAAAGVGAKELQELARHSDPRLTLGLYSHTTTEQKAAAVGRLWLPGAGKSPYAGMTREQIEIALALSQGLLRLFVFGESGATGGATESHQ